MTALTAGRARLPAAVVAGAALLVLGVRVRPPLLRAVVELPIALVLPGAALLLALGWRRSDAPQPVSVAAAVVLSCAFYPLLGLVLYGLSIRYSAASFTAGTAVVVGAAVVVHRFRRLTSRLGPGSGPPEWASPGAGWAEAAGRDGLRWAAWFGAVVAAIALVVLAGVTLLPGTPSAPYTQLYLSGSWARVTGPVPVGSGPLQVPVKVHNAGPLPRAYVLDDTVDGAPAGFMARFDLSAGATWSGSVSAAGPGPGCLQQLSVRLRDAASGRTVGTVDTWLTSTTAGRCAS